MSTTRIKAKTRTEKGQEGEARAAAALKQAGYSILDRNWRPPLATDAPRGEIDLIAQHGEQIVIIEVRWRAAGIDMALESITPRKQAQLERLANAYLDARKLPDTAYRIDVVAVSPTAIEIIENAVGW